MAAQIKLRRSQQKSRDGKEPKRNSRRKSKDMDMEMMVVTATDGQKIIGKLWDFVEVCKLSFKSESQKLESKPEIQSEVILELTVRINVIRNIDFTINS